MHMSFSNSIEDPPSSVNDDYAKYLLSTIAPEENEAGRQQKMNGKAADELDLCLWLIKV